MLLRRNSVQNLFNGYYHDDNIAAVQAKNPSAISEDHIPLGHSANSSTTNEISNNNSNQNIKKEENTAYSS